MVSLKSARFYLQNQAGALSFACKTVPFLFHSLSFHFSFLFLFFFFPFSFLYLSFSFCFLFFSLWFPFPFLVFSLSFSFIFLSCSCPFPFLFLSFSFKHEPKSIIDASTWRNQHSWHIMKWNIIIIQWGIAIWKGPTANLSFLHLLKTNIQPIHILVSASFDGCSHHTSYYMTWAFPFWILLASCLSCYDPLQTLLIHPYRQLYIASRATTNHKYPKIG